MENLNPLRTFLAVYRLSSISRAAEAVHLTQPAVTKQIRQLEARVGRPLFVRQSRGVVATSAAHDLARRVGAHLDALEAWSAAVKLGSGSLDGTVHLGGPAEFLAAKLLPALAPLAEERIRVRVGLGAPDRLAEDLESGALDLAVLTVRRSGAAFELAPLYREELVLVGHPSWAGSLPRDVTARQGAALLDGVPLLAYGEELPLIRRFWRQVFDRVPTASAFLVVPDLRALVNAASAGSGVTVLPRYLVEDALAGGALVELLKPERAPTNQLYLAVRTARVHPRVAFVRDHLLRLAPGWS